MDHRRNSTTRTDAVKMKLMALKQQTEAASKRSVMASDEIARTETRTRKALNIRHKIEQEITNREVMLERVDALISSMKAKKCVLDHFIADQQRRYQSPARESENSMYREIRKFAEQTKNTTRKYNACVERLQSVERGLDATRARISAAEKSVRSLEETLEGLKQSLVALENERAKESERRETVRCLESQLCLALIRAEWLEGKEAMLEMSIIDLEDKVEVHQAKSKRISSVLAEHSRARSLESNSISELLSKTSLRQANPTCIH